VKTSVTPYEAEQPENKELVQIEGGGRKGVILRFTTYAAFTERAARYTGRVEGPLGKGAGSW